MRKTVFCLFVIVLMLFGFVACDSEITSNNGGNLDWDIDNIGPEQTPDNTFEMSNQEQETLIDNLIRECINNIPGLWDSEILVNGEYKTDDGKAIAIVSGTSEKKLIEITFNGVPVNNYIIYGYAQSGVNVSTKYMLKVVDSNNKVCLVSIEEGANDSFLTNSAWECIVEEVGKLIIRFTDSEMKIIAPDGDSDTNEYSLDGTTLTIIDNQQQDKVIVVELNVLGDGNKFEADFSELLFLEGIGNRVFNRI